MTTQSRRIMSSDEKNLALSFGLGLIRGPVRGLPSPAAASLLLSQFSEIPHSHPHPLISDYPSYLIKFLIPMPIGCKLRAVFAVF